MYNWYSIYEKHDQATNELDLVCDKMFDIDVEPIDLDQTLNDLTPLLQSEIQASLKKNLESLLSDSGVVVQRMRHSCRSLHLQGEAISIAAFETAVKELGADKCELQPVSDGYDGYVWAENGVMDKVCDYLKLTKKEKKQVMKKIGGGPVVPRNTMLRLRLECKGSDALCGPSGELQFGISKFKGGTNVWAHLPDLLLAIDRVGMRSI